MKEFYQTAKKLAHSFFLKAQTLMNSVMLLSNETGQGSCMAPLCRNVKARIWWKESMQYQLGLKLTIGPWTDGCLHAADQVTQDNPAFSRGSIGKRKTLFATHDSSMGIKRPYFLGHHLPLESNWLSGFRTRLIATWAKGRLFVTVQSRTEECRSQRVHKRT